jgi:hypothetical protein
MAKCTHRVCGRDFSGLTAFDRHLRWLRVDPWVECRDPVEAGLVWSESRTAWSTHIGRLSHADPDTSDDTPTAACRQEGPNVNGLGAL